MPSQPSRKRRPGGRSRKRGWRALVDWYFGSSSLTMWREGVILPLIPILFGLFPLISGHFEWRGRRGRNIVLDGGPARALGLAAIAFGACVHFHFFWTRHQGLIDYSQRAMIVGVLVFLVSFGYMTFAR